MIPNWDEGTWDSGFWDEPTAPVFSPLPTKTKKTNPRTMAHVVWSYATRMTGTRVLRKLPGPDEEFASVGTSAGLEKVLTGQPVGALIEIQVVPYNEGGDGSASPTKTLTVT